jgi:hypothetical protein
MRTPDTLCAAFQGGRCLAKGPLAEVALAAKAALDASAHDPSAPSVLVFDHATAEVIELDWRGTPEEVLARLQAQAQGTPTASPGLSQCRMIGAKPARQPCPSRRAAPADPNSGWWRAR